MSNRQSIGSGQHFVLRAALWWATIKYFWLGRTVVIGAENFTAVPNMVLLTNHRRIEDSFFFACALFRQLAKHQPELLPWNVPKRKWYTTVWPISLFLRLWRTVPVRIDPATNQTKDTGAINRLVRLLQAGNIVHLFPEGTRAPTDVMLPLQPGPMSIVLLARSSVLPAYYVVTGRHRIISLGRHLDADEIAKLAGEGKLGARSRQLALALTEDFRTLRQRALTAHQHCCA